MAWIFFKFYDYSFRLARKNNIFHCMKKTQTKYAEPRQNLQQNHDLQVHLVSQHDQVFPRSSTTKKYFLHNCSDRSCNVFKLNAITECNFSSSQWARIF